MARGTNAGYMTNCVRDDSSGFNTQPNDPLMVRLRHKHRRMTKKSGRCRIGKTASQGQVAEQEGSEMA